MPLQPASKPYTHVSVYTFLLNEIRLVFSFFELAAKFNNRMYMYSFAIFKTWLSSYTAPTRTESQISVSLAGNNSLGEDHPFDAIICDKGRESRK